MMSPIGPSLPPAIHGTPAQNRPAAAFAQMLEAAVGRVEASRADAEVKVNRFLSGDAEELHTAALAVQKSELELELFLQIRNKVVQAYQEIMRSQI